MAVLIELLNRSVEYFHCRRAAPRRHNAALPIVASIEANIKSERMSIVNRDEIFCQVG